MLDALKALGDIEGSTDVERFLLPGVTPVPIDRSRHVSSAELIEVQERRSRRTSQALPRFYFAGLLRSSAGLLLWELVSRLLVANPLFLAAPSQIVHAISR